MSIAFSFTPPSSHSYSHSHSSPTNKSISSFPFSSTSLRLRFTPTPSPSFRINRRRDLPFVLHSTDAGGGGGSFGGHGGSGGGGGGGEDNDGHGGNSGNKDALMILANAGRSLESVPSDLAAAIKDGKIPASVVSRFLELEKSPFLRWLLQFAGFKERLLADDLFLAKVGFECGVGVFTKVSFSLFSISLSFCYRNSLVIKVKHGETLKTRCFIPIEGLNSIRPVWIDLFRFI